MRGEGVITYQSESNKMKLQIFPYYNLVLKHLSFYSFFDSSIVKREGFELWISLLKIPKKKNVNWIRPLSFKCYF